MGYINIKIAAAFFKEISDTRSQFVDILQDDFQLLDLLFEELGNYMHRVKEQAREKGWEIEKMGKYVDYAKMSTDTYFDIFQHSE